MLVAVADELVRPELAEDGATPDGRFKVTNLMVPDHGQGPQAYIVKSASEHAKVGTHFHLGPQFQVFLEGGGTFQRHDIEIISIHFTDAYSTYGPIVAGDEGLTFAVFRERFDPGANYMPGSRDKLVGVPGRNLEITLETAEGAAHTVLTSDPDGLRVELHTIAAGEERSITDGENRAACYSLILSGAARVATNGKQPVLDSWSCVFSKPGDPALAVRAETQGAQVLILGFPEVGHTLLAG